MIDLDAIRARDQSPYMQSTTWLSQSEEDRRALLAYVDALREAAGKVTCHRCGNTGKALQPLPGGKGAWTEATCPDCAALRALLERQP